VPIPATLEPITEADRTPDFGIARNASRMLPKSNLRAIDLRPHCDRDIPATWTLFGRTGHTRRARTIGLGRGLVAGKPHVFVVYIRHCQ
jgi:hypothetical protein